MFREGHLTCLPVTGQRTAKVVYYVIGNGDSLTVCGKETILCVVQPLCYLRSSESILAKEKHFIFKLHWVLHATSKESRVPWDGRGARLHFPSFQMGAWLLRKEMLIVLDLPFREMFAPWSSG